MHVKGYEESGSDEDEIRQAPLPDAVYDPADFADLDVPNDVHELFQFIDAYTPQTVRNARTVTPGRKLCVFKNRIYVDELMFFC